MSDFSSQKIRESAKVVFPNTIMEPFIVHRQALIYPAVVKQFRIWKELSINKLSVKIVLRVLFPPSFAIGQFARSSIMMSLGNTGL